jgi:signal transduction histidine kinase
MKAPFPLFRRYYFLTIFIVLIFITVGFISSRLVLRLTAPNPNEGRRFIFYAHLIDYLNSDHRDQALAQINKLNAGEIPLHLALVDDKGNVLDPPSEHFNLPWAQTQKPQEPYEFLHELVRFPGEPAQYLAVTQDRSNGRPDPKSLWPSAAYMRTFTSMVVSVLLGIALSMLLIFRALREQTRLADSVLADLQGGNLKARFPIKRMDEIGQTMSRFNRMAEEIERLVDQLKTAEKSRMKLLQELAHDLRTPVASQKNLLETMIVKDSGIEPKLRQELMSLALKEANYFERLVEDLLTLAQVSEPRYHEGGETVSINALLEDEAESVALQYGSTKGKVHLKKDISSAPLEIRGDAHLLRRMIRNGLENAFSFAKSEVTVRLRRENAGLISIAIEDDGSGFSETSLHSFGERKISRTFEHSKADENEKSGRLSVGLGSVILKTVAQMHGGSATARNRMSGNQVAGASVTITLRV